MRTPLNTAVMGLQYLRRELVKSSRDSDLLDVVDEVRDACEISVTILNEMLDYDKLQSGGMKLELEEVPVKEYLETTISPFCAQVRCGAKCTGNLNINPSPELNGIMYHFLLATIYNIPS